MQECETHEFSESEYQQAAEVAETARKGTVYVEVDIGTRFSTGGTGWVYDEQHVITNKHVIEPNEGLVVHTIDGEDYEAEVIWKPDDRTPDIAVLEVSEGSLSNPIPIAENNSPTEGDTVVLVSHPQNIGYWVPSIGKEQGEDVSDDSRLIEIPSTTGSSGGPVVGLDGDLLGMNWGRGNVKDAPDIPQPVDLAIYESLPYQQRSRAVYHPTEVIENAIEGVI